MGRRPPHRRLSRLVAALAALLLLAGGCARLQPTTDDPRAGQILSDRLNAAARDQALPAFVANFAGDSATSAFALRWYRYLVASGATVTADGGSSLKVTSNLPGDRRQATTTVATTLGTRDGRPVVTAASAADHPPLWALEPVDLTAAERGTLVSSGLAADTREAIADRLDRAAEAVATSGVVSPNEEWSGRIVVEVPATAADFAAVSGFDARDTAAATECREGTPRIVVSPDLDQQGDDATLLHEAVHAATNSACGVGTDWAVEGLAEWVTGRVHPQVAEDNRALVRAYLREHGVPDHLPSDLTTQTDYALAVVVVDGVFAHLPHAVAVESLDRIIHDPSAAPGPIRSAKDWYLAELRRVARSG